MSNNKTSMSASYKAVFAFAIFMAFLTLLSGAGTRGKGTIGVIFWGYAAWLMYKRDNQSLVSFFKTFLWIEGIAGLIGVLVILFSDTNYLDLSLGGLIVLFGILMGIDYALLLFFKSQLTSKANTTTEVYTANTPASSSNDENLWAEAARELNSSDKNSGLWTKCFVLSNGDEKKAEVEYLKQRFEQLKAKELTAQVLPITKPKESPRVQAYVQNVEKSNKGFIFALLFASLGGLAFLGWALQSTNNSKTSSSASPVQSSVNLMGRINNKEVIPAPASASVLKNTEQAYTLPWLSYRLRLNRQQVEQLEDSSHWAVSKNWIYIELKNQNPTKLLSIVYSLSDANCASKSQNKIYLNIDFLENPINAYSSGVIMAPIPFDYKAVIGSGARCGEVEAAFAQQ